MKSFIAFPFEIETPNEVAMATNASGKIVAHYELFKKIKHLNGAIVKCGVNSEQELSRFAMAKAMAGKKHMEVMVVFEKDFSFFEEETTAEGEIVVKIKKNGIETASTATRKRLVEMSKNLQINFVCGDAGNEIPNYLIDNPELKISLLSIDFDDYEATTNALMFLYPRLVQGGILIIENYYKEMADKKAVDDYFGWSPPVINSFLVNKGPHYLIRP